MKALSLTRPWPELILRCGKRIENRTWSTQYRGPVLLHAAKSWRDDALDFAEDVAEHLGQHLGLAMVGALPTDHPTGIMGVAELVDVCTASQGSDLLACQCGPWAFPGQCHWRLDRVRRLQEPVPVAGRLGLWEAPDDLVRAVRVALRGVAGPVTAAQMAAAGLPWGADAARAGVVLP